MPQMLRQLGRNIDGIGADDISSGLRHARLLLFPSTVDGATLVKSFQEGRRMVGRQGGIDSWRTRPGISRSCGQHRARSSS